MPTAYIKKLAAEGKGTVAELEKKWEKAKQIAAKEGQADNYAYVTSIFQNTIGIKGANMDQLSPGQTVPVRASQRLRQLKAYAPQPNVNFGQTSELHGSNTYLDSLVDSGKFTRDEVDKAWDRAKKMADKNAKDNPNIVPSYAYTTAIFQSILGIKEKASVEIKAFARLATVKHG